MHALQSVGSCLEWGPSVLHGGGVAFTHKKNSLMVWSMSFLLPKGSSKAITLLMGPARTNHARPRGRTNKLTKTKKTQFNLYPSQFWLQASIIRNLIAEMAKQWSKETEWKWKSWPGAYNSNPGSSEENTWTHERWTEFFWEQRRWDHGQTWWQQAWSSWCDDDDKGIRWWYEGSDGSNETWNPSSEASNDEPDMEPDSRNEESDASKPRWQGAWRPDPVASEPSEPSESSSEKYWWNKWLNGTWQLPGGGNKMDEQTKRMRSRKLAASFIRDHQDEHLDASSPERKKDFKERLAAVESRMEEIHLSDLQKNALSYYDGTCKKCGFYTVSDRLCLKCGFLHATSSTT